MITRNLGQWFLSCFEIAQGQSCINLFCRSFITENCALILTQIPLSQRMGSFSFFSILSHYIDFIFNFTFDSYSDSRVWRTLRVLRQFSFLTRQLSCERMNCFFFQSVRHPLSVYMFVFSLNLFFFVLSFGSLLSCFSFLFWRLELLSVCIKRQNLSSFFHT